MNSFLRRVYCFTVLPAGYEGSDFSASSIFVTSIFSIVAVLVEDEVPHCDFIKK